jgi:hypothetical protein
MFIRIHRDPEGADSAGTETALADTQSPVIDASEGSQSEAIPEAQAPVKDAPADKGKRLAELLKKKPGYKATDEELDLIDEYTKGKIKPEGDAEAEPENEEKPKETKAAPVSELMKEVGAKSEAEALEKVRELKRFTGSRDAQAYKTLEREHQDLKRDSKAEMQLWADLKDAKNAPKAIAYLESQLQAAKARHGIQPGQQAEGEVFIDPKSFAVPEEAAALNAALGKHFGSLKSTIEKQADIIRRLEEGETKRSQEHQLITARASQLDEFVDVAALIPDLKSIAGLREKVNNFLTDPNAVIPELQILDQVMAEANKEKVPLRVAWKMVEAERLRQQIAGAEDRGIKKAFAHKPNPSLSDVQGRAAHYTNYTDTQLKAMANGKMEIPGEWFDKNDNLDKTKMPKRAVDLLLAEENGS